MNIVKHTMFKYCKILMKVILSRVSSNCSFFCPHPGVSVRDLDVCFTVWNWMRMNFPQTSSNTELEPFWYSDDISNCWRKLKDDNYLFIFFLDNLKATICSHSFNVQGGIIANLFAFRQNSKLFKAKLKLMLITFSTKSLISQSELSRILSICNN